MSNLLQVRKSIIPDTYSISFKTTKFGQQKQIVNAMR